MNLLQVIIISSACNNSFFSAVSMGISEHEKASIYVIKFCLCIYICETWSLSLKEEHNLQKTVSMGHSPSWGAESL
jgi:hypothetical protein